MLSWMRSFLPFGASRDLRISEPFLVICKSIDGQINDVLDAYPSLVLYATLNSAAVTDFFPLRDFWGISYII